MRCHEISSTMPDQPLDGVSVLELSTMIAGPYAGQLLGDLGANVVKIERPSGGELARRLNPTVGGESFYYLTANRNKRSLALDVSEKEGREVFLELASEADVVLENFPPTFTEAYGIDYDAVRERNENIVYCSISAYGDTGPHRTDPGIDTTVQALTGAMSMTRDNDTPPMRSGMPMNDVFAALYASQSIITALFNRERTGVGDHLDISLLDVGVAGLTTRGMYSLVTDEPYPPFGRRHNYFAPEGVYEAIDGEVQLSVVTDRHWQWFCEALDEPELAADHRFEKVNRRVSNRVTLDETLAPVLREWSVDDLVDALQEAGVPVAPINNTVDVWNHPQVEARGLRQELEHPQAGTVDTVATPVKYRNIKPCIDRHPPLLGEHSAEVLAESGYTNSEITTLAETSVVQQYKEGNT